MSLVDLVLMSFGVSMDAAAVSISNGLSMCGRFSWKNALKMALLFGFFQGVMPMIGFRLATSFCEQIDAWDHWIAFGLLAWIGIGMIRSSGEDRERDESGFSISILLPLALATSIDALALGVSLAFLHANILSAAAMMSGVTFIICLVAAYLGCRVQGPLADKAEFAGGIILLFLGTKILIEHVMH